MGMSSSPFPSQRLTRFRRSRPTHKDGPRPCDYFLSGTTSLEELRLNEMRTGVIVQDLQGSDAQGGRAEAQKKTARGDGRGRAHVRASSCPTPSSCARRPDARLSLSAHLIECLVDLSSLDATEPIGRSARPDTCRVRRHRVRSLALPPPSSPPGSVHHHSVLHPQRPLSSRAMLLLSFVPSSLVFAAAAAGAVLLTARWLLRPRPLPNFPVAPGALPLVGHSLDLIRWMIKHENLEAWYRDQLNKDKHLLETKDGGGPKLLQVMTTWKQPQ